MPSTPIAANSRPSAITSAVLYPPAPASTGTRPFASSTVISTTRKCSSCVSVGLSPVVPHGTRKSIPASIWRLISARSVDSSSEPSRQNGVTSAVPVPVNMVFLLLWLNVVLPKSTWRPKGRRYEDPSTQFAEDLLKFVEPFSAGDPARCLQSAARKTFAAVRCVAQRDGIGSGIETDFVRTGNRAGAIRAEADWPRVTPRVHFFGKFFERAGGRVFFCGMVNFPAPGFVLRMLGEKNGSVRNDLQKKIHAHGKIRSPHEPGLCVEDSFARNRKLFEPAGGANNGVDA